MKKERILMLITAIASALEVVWAITIPAPFMAILLILNTLFSLYVFAFKL